MARVNRLIMRLPPTPRAVSVEQGGRIYSGTYEVRGDLLSLRHGTERKTAHLGGRSPDALAELLLREFVRERSPE
jgi:hypothetical protein